MYNCICKYAYMYLILNYQIPPKAESNTKIAVSIAVFFFNPIFASPNLVTEPRCYTKC